VEHRNLHTWAMRMGGGLAIVPIALAVVLALAPLRRLRDEQKRLWGAAVLHAAVRLRRRDRHADQRQQRQDSGALPWLHRGRDAGVDGHRLPPAAHAGLPRPAGAPGGLAALAVRLGQLMHIIGLVWSGGYGVQRKVAGSEQVLRSTAEVAGMGLMGLGGLIAIIGGLLFVVVVLRAMRSRPTGRCKA
jgi:hypothetical protein